MTIWARRKLSLWILSLLRAYFSGRPASALTFLAGMEVFRGEGVFLSGQITYDSRMVPNGLVLFWKADWTNGIDDLRRVPITTVGRHKHIKGWVFHE